MARRKISDTAEKLSIDLADIGATDKQAGFAFDYVANKGASASYRLHYDCENMNAASIAVEASRLLANPKVSLIISMLRQAHFGDALVSRDKHLRELERLREIALNTGNVGAAVQAEQLRGKVEGHYIERFEDVTKTDPSEVLKELAKIAPDAARALAQEHGLQITEETQH